MDPLLATGAISLAGQLVRNLTAPKEPKAGQIAPADQPRFAELLAKANNSPQVRMAQYLSDRGIHTAAEGERRLEQLSSQLTQSPEIQAFVAGSSSSYSMRIAPDGNVTVQTSDGRERTFALSENNRKIAGEMHTIGAALRSSGGPVNGMADGSVNLRVTPGAGVSLDGIARIR